jgi:O-antigen ligase
MKTAADSPAATKKNVLPEIFAALFGALLGLGFLKFGNPAILEKLITWPQNFFEWLLNSWPLAIGYWLLAGITVLGVAVARWRKDLPLGLIALPLVWLIWEMLAATQTVSPALSHATVLHFGACVACFYLGLFSLNQTRSMGFFWAGILAGFLIVIALGFQQHFGGLAATRKYWFLYVYPTATDIPTDLLKKMQSNRIFSTLFYPNTLAGVILMLLPVTLALMDSLRQRFTAGARRLLMAIWAFGALACLFWSGSKGGWLLMLFLGIVGAMFLPLRRQFKIMIVAAVLVLGLAGFTIKYLGYFKHGATSVEARFDYWRAAVQTVNDRPLFGTGPGTFAIAYAQRKKPEMEMAKLTHNDYLEQASDSGIPGLLIYATWVIGTLIYAWRKCGLQRDWIRLGVWLGLLGWALQSFMEFGLYIPAIGWLAFALMGWLLGQGGNQFDSRPPAS